jgi:hypothetical protein
MEGVVGAVHSGQRTVDLIVVDVLYIQWEMCDLCFSVRIKMLCGMGTLKKNGGASVPENWTSLEVCRLMIIILWDQSSTLLKLVVGLERPAVKRYNDATSENR